MRILLAEDNRINQQLAVRVLKIWGHDVTVAQDGEEALALYQTHPFDLILMDIHMPRMDGLEVTARIRELEKDTGRHIRIIAFTTSVETEDLQRYQATGMDDVVPKPIDRGQFFEALEKTRATVEVADGT